MSRLYEGIFTVYRPLQWIVDDVFPNTGELIFILDDVFVIVSLPHGHTRSCAYPIDFAC